MPEEFRGGKAASKPASWGRLLGESGTSTGGLRLEQRTQGSNVARRAQHEPGWKKMEHLSNSCVMFVRGQADLSFVVILVCDKGKFSHLEPMIEETEVCFQNSVNQCYLIFLILRSNYSPSFLFEHKGDFKRQ